MDVLDKLSKLLQKADNIVDITKPSQLAENPKIAYGVESYKDNMLVYGIKVTRDVPPLPNLYETAPVLNWFSGDKINKTSEQMFVLFENIVYDNTTSDGEVLPLFAPKIHKIKRIKSAKLKLEYKNYPILETENVEEINSIYRTLQERYAYLDAAHVENLRKNFCDI